MKKCLLMMFVLVFSCFQSSAQESPSPKILITYYSYSGNTQNIANQISEIVGGDIFRIEPLKSYPEDMDEILKVSKEEIDSNYNPPLKAKVDNIGQYDIIFVGTPNWYNTIAPPVASFLAEHDLSGKTIVPFSTHGGGGEANCFTDIKAATESANILEGIAIYEGSIGDVNQKLVGWLNAINVINK